MMRRTIALGKSVLGKFALAGALVVAGPLSAIAQPADPSGDQAIAERLAKLAQLSLSKPDLGDDNFRQAAALLQGACRLNPNEPRFSRLLVEAQLQLKNTQGSIEALELYLKSNKTDQVARLQLVDLYASEMETAERRLAYYTQDLMPIESLPAEFRSAIAVRAARLYLDRDQTAMASGMIDQALALNPLNPEACELNWEGVKDSGTTVEKVAALLGSLRANPAQPQVMTQLGAVLAGAGMHDPAQRWYTRSFEVTQRMGRPVSKEAMIDAAASSFILGQTKTAETRVSSLLDFDPSVYDAHLIRIIAARRLGGNEVGAKATDSAVDSLAARVNALHKELAGEESPTTKPSGDLSERIPDPAADAALLKDKIGTPIADAYAAAWSDLAFVTLMYGAKPTDADAAVAALRATLPAESIVLSRLEGLQLLQGGKTEEARTRLSSIADRDPIAKMALIRLQASEDKAAASLKANEMLVQYRAGLLGAILVDGFSQLDIKLEPVSEETAAVNDVLSKFPSEWLNILDKPQDFYSLTATAGKVPFAFGEPILATVTIQNTSNYDIALTSTGTIRPDLWFDCSMRGIQQQQIPGVAFERFGQSLVLRRGAAINHVARIDQGQLWLMMQQNPAASFPLFYTVFTNPVPTATIAGPGPAGYRFTLRAIERQPVSLNARGARDNIFKLINLGTGEEKIRTQEVLAQYSNLIARQADAPPEAAATAQELREAIEQGMSDANPQVRAFATYVITQISPEPRKSELAVRLSNSTDWVQRMLVLAAVEGFTPELRAELLTKLVNDEDAAVKQLASATDEYLQRVPPTTQPADDAAPATQPGN